MSTDRHADTLIEHDYKVDALRKFLISGEVGLKDVPEALAKVLEEDAWRDRVDWRTRERFTFDRFEDFVTAEPQAGLGATVEIVERLVRGNLEAERLLRLATKRRPGRQQSGNNMTPSRRSKGDRRDYILDRLHRDGRNDLLARIQAGELSPHAAAIEAGFRHRTVQARVDSPEHAVRALLRHFTADQLRHALDTEDMPTPGVESTQRP
jgi:hypothetical protein